MAKKKLKTNIRNICLAIQICSLLVASGLDMAVLCHAEDGHAQIEAANAEGCATSPEDNHEDHQSEDRNSQFSDNHDCGDCVDVPLSIGRADTLKKTYTESTPVSIILATPSDRTVDANAHKLLTQLLLPPPYIGPLSSIVLLI